MAQIVVSEVARLTGIHPRAADAEAFAKLARAGFPGSAFSASTGGVSINIDQQALTAGARLASEAAALGRAAANAIQGVSILQTADQALVEIGDRLTTLEKLAKEASSATTDFSSIDRAILDTEFQAVKAEVNAIADRAAFGDTALLKGGSGPGGALQLTVKAGTGARSADDIVINFGAATVSALSPGLETADLLTQAGAATALTAVQTARDTLDTRRAEVSGGIVRLASAANSAGAQAAVLDRAGRDQAAPEISVDFSQLLAEQVADEGGINLTRGTRDLLQGLLLRLDSGNEADGRREPLPSPSPPSQPEPSTDPAR